MRKYILTANDDDLNKEQRVQIERAGFEYDDFGGSEYRRQYYLKFDHYDEASELVELLEGIGEIEWTLKTIEKKGGF